MELSVLGMLSKQAKFRSNSVDRELLPKKSTEPRPCGAPSPWAVRGGHRGLLAVPWKTGQTGAPEILTQPAGAAPWKREADTDWVAARSAERRARQGTRSRPAPGRDLGAGPTCPGL